MDLPARPPRGTSAAIFYAWGYLSAAQGRHTKDCPILHHYLGHASITRQWWLDGFTACCHDRGWPVT